MLGVLYVYKQECCFDFLSLFAFLVLKHTGLDVYIHTYIYIFSSNRQQYHICMCGCIPLSRKKCVFRGHVCMRSFLGRGGGILSFFSCIVVVHQAFSLLLRCSAWTATPVSKYHFILYTEREIDETGCMRAECV